MKIAIIGAGWVGCHLAIKLKNHHDVTLYEEDDVFSKTSLRNQNRLHLGFHYARNSDTRYMCRDTFNRFISEYNFLVSDIDKNIYSIPSDSSLLDYETYIKIFDEWNYQWVNMRSLQNIDGSISVNEKYIDPVKSKRFFTDKLYNNIVNKKVTEEDLERFKDEYDIVLNCTNNIFNQISINTRHEDVTLFSYKKKRETEFDALTLVDGNLFSIFPYLDNTFLLSDVEYSPMPYISDADRIELMEQRVEHYFPEFKKHFVRHGVNKSVKSKIKNLSDPRVPVFEVEDNIVNIFTGKIQGVFLIEDFVYRKIESME